MCIVVIVIDDDTMTLYIVIIVRYTDITDTVIPDTVQCTRVDFDAMPAFVAHFIVD